MADALVIDGVLAQLRACNRCRLRYLGSRDTREYADPSPSLETRLRRLRGAGGDAACSADGERERETKRARSAADELGAHESGVCPLCIGILQEMGDGSDGLVASGASNGTEGGAVAGGDGGSEVGQERRARGVPRMLSPVMVTLAECYSPGGPTPSEKAGLGAFDPDGDKKWGPAEPAASFEAATASARAALRPFAGWALDLQLPATLLVRGDATAKLLAKLRAGEAWDASGVERPGRPDLPAPSPTSVRESLKLWLTPALEQAWGPGAANADVAKIKVTASWADPLCPEQAGWLHARVPQDGVGVPRRRSRKERQAANTGRGWGRGRGRGSGRGGGRGEGGEGADGDRREGAAVEAGPAATPAVPPPAPLASPRVEQELRAMGAEALRKESPLHALVHLLLADGTGVAAGGGEGSAGRGRVEALPVPVVPRTFAFAFSPASPASLDLRLRRAAVFVGGRYVKLRRHLPQSRWIVDGARKGGGSVEEAVANVVLPAARAASHAFLASGREDADVRMLGAGRPFALELKNCRLVPRGEAEPADDLPAGQGEGDRGVASRPSIRSIEDEINACSAETGVAVAGLRVLSDVELGSLKDSAADKRKSYAAVCWVPLPVSAAEVARAAAAAPLTVEQATPTRVLHRRANLVRCRVIHRLEIEPLVLDDGVPEPTTAIQARREPLRDAELRPPPSSPDGGVDATSGGGVGSGAALSPCLPSTVAEGEGPPPPSRPPAIPPPLNSLAERGWFLLRLETDAGTYVKEFVHGDFGRSRPSLADVLGVPDARIAFLDVTDVHVPGLLDA